MGWNREIILDNVHAKSSCMYVNNLSFETLREHTLASWAHLILDASMWYQWLLTVSVLYNYLFTFFCQQPITWIYIMMIAITCLFRSTSWFVTLAECFFVLFLSSLACLGLHLLPLLNVIFLQIYILRFMTRQHYPNT